MGKIGGTKSWVAAVGVALLLAFVVVPALSGAASATSVTSTTPAVTSTQWAYGGEGWSNNTLSIGNATVTWDAMFGWTVVFTATETGPNVTMIEEQRTVGITIAATFSGPMRTVNYHYHGQEVDAAFANITNLSTVYVNDVGVPALGILNASASIQAGVNESISETLTGLAHGPATRSAALEVSGSAQSSVSFSPSLGLIPLNLSGIHEWNSSATASPAASWQIGWSWNDQGFNGTTASGSGARSGSLSATVPVNLTGFKLVTVHPFSDHKVRVGVLLIIQGPFDAYDGFILVPHDFDMFGGAAQSYDSLGFGSASLSAQSLYLSSGPSGLTVTAADASFGSNDQTVNAQASPITGSAPAATSSPGATVEGQPMSVAQANSEAYGLTHPGSSAAASAASSGLFAALVIGAIVVVVIGTVGVIEWRSYARRKSQKQLVGGYGESWPNGVPPAQALPPFPQGPAGPSNGPGTVEDPNRRL
ncbi:MAG: hypothetical protein ABSA15_01955 [Thermoplasmata archaeon]